MKHRAPAAMIEQLRAELLRMDRDHHRLIEQEQAFFNKSKKNESIRHKQALNLIESAHLERMTALHQEEAIFSQKYQSLRSQYDKKRERIKRDFDHKMRVIENEEESAEIQYATEGRKQDLGFIDDIIAQIQLMQITEDQRFENTASRKLHELNDDIDHYFQSLRVMDSL